MTLRDLGERQWLLTTIHRKEDELLSCLRST